MVKPAKWQIRLLWRSNIEAVSEALLFASKAGADPVRVRPGADGRLCFPHVFWKFMASVWIKRTFNPGFKIALHQKDLNWHCKVRKHLR